MSEERSSAGNGQTSPAGCATDRRGGELLSMSHGAFPHWGEPHGKAESRVLLPTAQIQAPQTVTLHRQGLVYATAPILANAEDGTKDFQTYKHQSLQPELQSSARRLGAVTYLLWGRHIGGRIHAETYGLHLHQCNLTGGAALPRNLW